ncbi:MAG: insulinase family protein [Clostridia bacterium]|nr:insulinase family protein [Clostridia bacterium]
MITTKILKNNMTFLGHQIKDVRSVSFSFWIRSGVITESEVENGVSHFLEHMLFKGTAKLNSKEIAHASDLLGGNINAYTTKEHVCLYGKVLDEDFMEALSILSDMLNAPLISEEEIEKEKKVVLDEIAMYNDTPEELGYDILCKILFPESHYGMPILGEKETVTQFQREQLVDYYREHFNTGEIIFSIAGNYDEAETIEYLEKNFTNYIGEVAFPDMNFGAIEMQSGYKYVDKELEQIHVHVGFKGLQFNDKDSYPLMALNNILGGTSSSRLFQKVREDHGLAYSIDTQPVFHEDIGFFNLYFSSSQGEVEETVMHIIDEIKLIKSGDITDDEYKVAISNLKVNYLMGLETSEDHMNFMGKSYYYLKRIITNEEIVEEIDQITKERVLALAKRILTGDILAVSVVGPLSEERTKKIYDAFREEL